MRNFPALARFLCAASLLAGVSGIARADDTKFTIAVIPDTQNYIDFSHQTAAGYPFDARDMFLKQMHYIASNLRGQGGDIVFVDALGDIWQHQSKAIDPAHEARGFRRAPNPIFDKLLPPTPKVQTIEMPTARQGFEMLAGKVPFSVVPGNHDYDAMWTDANHPPAAKPDLSDLNTLGVSHVGGLDNFRTVFGADTPFFRGKDWYVGSHDGGADSAQVFTAGGFTFLHIGLQFDAPDASIQWATDIIRQHPGLPTIISTHDYMTSSGERVSNPAIDNHKLDTQDNTPQMLWDKLISKNDQIFMVLCGHEAGQAFRVDPNLSGHPVYQILADYQDRGQTALEAGVPDSPLGRNIGDGWMRFLQFDLNRQKPVIHVRTYSTHYDKNSTDLDTYASWYKAHEKPKLSDKEFNDQDDFVIDLRGFFERFGR